MHHTVRRIHPSTPQFANPVANRICAYYNSPTANRIAQERAKPFGSRNKTISPEALEPAIRRFESLMQSKRRSLMRELFEMGRLNGFKVRGL